jgi:hypothetical protein
MGIVVIGVSAAEGERVCGGIHRDLGGGDSGAAGQERRDRLAGDAVGLLWQEADGRVRRGEADAAGFGRLLAGEQAQQRRLAGAVRADQPDDVSGRDDQVEITEQDAVAMPGGEAFRDQRCAHKRARLAAVPDISPLTRGDLSAAAVAIATPQSDNSTDSRGRVERGAVHTGG